MSVIGKTLGHYEITGPLGKGGMGEVYRARDKKLGRDVAIKVLPEEFARDTDRVARFQREAKLLASLNHPNIAAIHGLEEFGGTHFLVMELIEGDTLADRVKSGPVAVEESLKLALQIAEALEAAHEKGVIHRDLKPANIKVTPEGKVKVLDFGLAKAFAGDQAEVNLSNSPTLSDAATQQGVILGTAAYMSPEQARGKTVDKRTDIWAFGCVLYEMLTGHAAFAGKDVTDILAAVIRSEPEWGSLPANLHARLREVLERCLKKELKDRYHDISDVRVDIQRVLADPGGVFAQPISAAEPKTRLRHVLPWIAATLVLTAVVAGAVVWYLKPQEPRRVMRFTYELPENQLFAEDIFLAVSPNGSQFVYGTTEGLYLRSVDALDARLLPGTNRSSMQPSFSPDGKWIGYVSANDFRIKKIAISGGAPIVLCDCGPAVPGLSWSPDNSILFCDLLGGGVKRVSADGGNPEILLKADLGQMAAGGIPVDPHLLPDGKAMLFTAVTDIQNTAGRQIAVQSLESGKRKTLFQGSGARYLPTGHILYASINNNAANLVAVPFDPEKLEVKGEPVPLIEEILNCASSDTGTLVYVPQPADAPGSPKYEPFSLFSSNGSKLVWVDRKGLEEPIKAPPNDYRYPKLSPDGTKIALTTLISGNADVWVLDLARGTLSRLTFDPGFDLQGIWTPDGNKIIYAAVLGARDGIYSKAADGTGEEEKLASLRDRTILPFSWSRDGKTLVISQSEGMRKWSLFTMPVEGNRELKPLPAKSNELQPQVSPDGRWMAYVSPESGKNEIYVRPFPDVNKGKWQISTEGGDSPRWSPDGRELFYLVGNTEAVMSVAVETEPAFKPGNPQVLFRGKYLGSLPANGVPWDVHPDGKRFLMIKESAKAGGASAGGETKAAGPRKINIVVNWFEDLKQRVPAK